MIDLPDYGYSDYRLTPMDPGGLVEATLGGPPDYVARPGYRYSITFSVNPLRVRDLARQFQQRLERGSREDVSYPWPLDFKPAPAGTPTVDGSSPAGAVIPIKGLLPGYAFREGQPVAVVSGGVGYIHRASEPTIAEDDGTVVLPVFPLTRATFSDDDLVEVERPRIRGVLSWDGSQQGAAGNRPFVFTISER